MSEPNLTSVSSPALQDIGQLVLERAADGSLNVVQADDVILVAQALVEAAEGIRAEGPLLTFATTPPLVYRVVARHGLDAFLAVREDSHERT
jgi:hypothetical protein